MTQKAIAELYQTTTQNVTIHIKNIYDENEMYQNTTCKDYLQVQIEGTREIKRNVKHYNLELIIAIGYRVRSHRGTQFRRWATERINEYLVKGFTMDDDRLKEMRNFGQDYFEELLQRIRDIRASEKRFYRKITDIYATSVDYDPQAELTKEFFSTVQNKLHYAIHGHTAAELIAERADAEKDNMGLTSWKGSKIGKSDVAIAKLNAFLLFNEREILQHAGKVSQEVAEKLALSQYEKYGKQLIETQQDQDDDFIKYIRDNRLK